MSGHLHKKRRSGSCLVSASRVRQVIVGRLTASPECFNQLQSFDCSIAHGNSRSPVERDDRRRLGSLEQFVLGDRGYAALFFDVR